MSLVLSQSARNLLEAALVGERPVVKLGNARWLYVRLLTAASYHGTICRHIGKLATDLSVTTERIEQWLKRLSDVGLIEIQSASPFLVIKLGMWSDSPQDAGDSKAVANSYPKQLLHKQQLNNSYRHEEEGVERSANDDLLGEILETLGESDTASFEKAVQLYSPSVIRAALHRVRRTQGIRKSRTALFRHLLPRIAKESQGNH